MFVSHHFEQVFLFFPAAEYYVEYEDNQGFYRFAIFKNGKIFCRSFKSNTQGLLLHNYFIYNDDEL